MHRSYIYWIAHGYTLHFIGTNNYNLNDNDNNNNICIALNNMFLRALHCNYFYPAADQPVEPTPGHDLLHQSPQGPFSFLSLFCNQSRENQNSEAEEEFILDLTVHNLARDGLKNLSVEKRNEVKKKKRERIGLLNGH